MQLQAFFTSLLLGVLAYAAWNFGSDFPIIYGYLLGYDEIVIDDKSIKCKFPCEKLKTNSLRASALTRLKDFAHKAGFIARKKYCLVVYIKADHNI